MIFIDSNKWIFSKILIFILINNNLIEILKNLKKIVKLQINNEFIKAIMQELMFIN